MGGITWFSPLWTAGPSMLICICRNSVEQPPACEPFSSGGNLCTFLKGQGPAVLHVHVGTYNMSEGLKGE